MDIDLNGELVIGGVTTSGNTSGATCAPPSNGDFPLCAGAPGAFYQSALNGGSSSGFIAKMNSSGILTWSTYLGGSGGDQIDDILVNQKNLYITGYAVSSGDPTESGNSTTNGTLPIKKGGTYGTVNTTNAGNGDIYIARFDVFAENMIWGTIYGGPKLESPSCLGMDVNGNIYVGGYNKDGGLPIISTNSYFYSQANNPSGANPSNFNGFLMLANPQNTIEWVTLWGGSNAPTTYGTNEGVKALVSTNLGGNTLFAGGVAYSTDVDYPYYCNSPAYCFDEAFTNRANLPDAFMASFDMTLATGIKENVFSSGSLKVFPNPATDELTLIYNSSGFYGSQKIRIFNDIGQLVYSNEIKEHVEQQIKINTSSWARGMYLVEVELDNLKLHEKFVKQ